MQEQKLEITQNGQYKNITVQTAYKWDKKERVFVFDAQGNKIVNRQGVKPDHYIIIKKKFPDAKEITTNFGTSYAWKAEYDGQEVSFFLKEFDSKKLASLGGVDDQIKISCVLEDKLNKRVGIKVPTEVLKFEKL
jgi:hypothetical protein